MSRCMTTAKQQLPQNGVSIYAPDTASDANLKISMLLIARKQISCRLSAQVYSLVANLQSAREAEKSEMNIDFTAHSDNAIALSHKTSQNLGLFRDAAYLIIGRNQTHCSLCACVTKKHSTLTSGFKKPEVRSSGKKE